MNEYEARQRSARGRARARRDQIKKKKWQQLAARPESGGQCCLGRGWATPLIAESPTRVDWHARDHPRVVCALRHNRRYGCAKGERRLLGRRGETGSTGENFQWWEWRYEIILSETPSLRIISRKLGSEVSLSPDCHVSKYRIHKFHTEHFFKEHRGHPYLDLQILVNRRDHSRGKKVPFSRFTFYVIASVSAVLIGGCKWIVTYITK